MYNCSCEVTFLCTLLKFDPHKLLVSCNRMKCIFLNWEGIRMIISSRVSLSWIMCGLVLTEKCFWGPKNTCMNSSLRNTVLWIRHSQYKKLTPTRSYNTIKIRSWNYVILISAKGYEKDYQNIIIFIL